MGFLKLSDVIGVRGEAFGVETGRYIYRFILVVSLTCLAMFAAFTAAAQSLAPQANAGADRAVITGSTFLLDGSASTLEGSDASSEALSYSWASISGPVEVALTAVETPRLSVSLAQAGTYRFALTVTNSAGETSIDEVEIIASDTAPMGRPVADAGMARHVETGVAAILDGSGSFAPSAQELTFDWSIVDQPAGSLAALVDSTRPRPVLTPDLAGEYSVQLIVTDSQGAVSAPQMVTLSTENVAPVASAGGKRVSAIGVPLRLDPEGSYDANGDRLDAAWSLLYAPAASSAQLSEDEGGRYVLTPDVAGDYVVQLAVTDSEGAVSYDTSLIYAGDGSDLLSANIAPVANAGADVLAMAGGEILLDGSRSSDANGDALSYHWSVLYKRADSFSQPLSPSAVRSAFTPDIDHLYIVQLAVTDSGGLTSFDTLVLSPQDIRPTAISGGPDAQADGAILNMAATLDGSASVNGSGFMTGLSYEWSILGLSKGTSQISSADSVLTDVVFPEERHGEITDASSIAALELLRDYTLISFGDLNAHADSLGRVLVGGDVQGPSATFGTAIVPANGIDVLTVIGEIKGGAKNINNGGNVRIKGKAKSRLNFNGGGQLITDSSLSIYTAEQQLNTLSDDLRALPANSNVSLPSGQPGPALLTATPNGDGVAVFEVADGNALFKNNSVQQIELEANGADTIIINVGGNNINFNKGNFTGAVTTDELSQKIIWNFYEASQLKIFRAFEGSILAPNAYVHNMSKIDGSVVGARVLKKAPIGFPVFGGTGLDIVELDPTHYALAQLAVTDTANPAFGPSYATTVLTTGNKRPVAQIIQSGGPDPLTPGIDVGLNGAGSSDGDSDALSYSWSILSKPEGSQSLLSNNMAANVSLTPDAVGFYVVQLIASDGALLSRPTTLIFEAQNTPPTANAGAAQTVFKNAVVALDGSASSDPDGDDLTYLWVFAERPEGSQAVLTDAESAFPSFVADIKGDYVVTLVVNDGFADSQSDDVTITVQNRAPIAVATGPADGFTGDVITVSGASSSDPDGDVLTYLWTLQTPAGSSTILSDASAQSPMFTADEAGLYTLSLTVSDGTVTSAPASLSISIEGGNAAPVLAAIGPQSVALGKSIVLGVTASDSDGDPLAFFINPAPLPSGASFDTQTGLFTFTPTSLTPGVYNLSFGVSDGALSDTETITLNVTDEGSRPTTEYTGRVVDAVTGNPIAGVTVKVGAQVTTTDINGVFTVTDLTAGPVLVCIEPNASTPLAGNGNAYGSVEYTASLIENVSNEPSSDIQLVPTSASAPVTVGQATIINDDVSGVTLDVPADGFEVIGAQSQYWRVFTTRVNDSRLAFRHMAVAELEFRSELGVNQAVSGGNPVSSLSATSSARRDPENAFDGDLSNAWESRSGAGGAESAGWIGYDYGPGNDLFVKEVVMSSTFRLEELRDAPLDFDIQTSEDGVNWTTLKSFTTPRWARSETRSFDLGVPYDGPLSISSLTPAQAQSLPDNITPCKLFAIEPKNVVSVKPVTLTVENYDNLPVGAAVDVWSFRNGRFQVIGTGIVSTDAQEVVATLENLTGGDLIALAPRLGAINVASDVPGRTYVPGLLNEGNFSTALSLPGYSSNGQNRALSFVYNSTAAAPSPIISANYTAGSLVPNTISAQVEIGGVRYGVPTSAATGQGGDALGEGEIARQAVQLNASNLQVGRNAFKFISTSKFDCSTVSNVTTGEVFIDNQIESPFGRGWTMAELSKLYPQEDGSVIIREGTGQIKDFTPQTDFSQLQDPIKLPLLGPSNGDIFDLDNDGDNDVIWRAEERGGLIIYENMGEGNFEEKPLLSAGNIRDVPDAGDFTSDITGIAIGDVDNDGYIDIVSGTQTSDTVYIFFGSVNGLDAYNRVIVDTTDSRAVGVGDMDGDGIDDIISFGGSLGTNSYFYKGGATRTFLRERLSGTTDARAVIGLTIADFNGDGLQDAFARTSGGLYVFEGVQDNVPARATSRSASNFATTLGRLSAVTDWTQDGRPDYIIGTRIGDIALYQQNSNGTFSGVRRLGIADGDVSEFDLADLNGDGIADILSTSGSKVVTWLGLEDGDFGEAEVVETGFNFGSPVLGDLNGDGAFDVVGDSQATDELFLYFSDPTRSSKYIDPLTDYTALNRNEDGSYTRRYNDGTVLEYSAAGLQTSITDSNGNATLYAYDSEERVTSITDPVGLVTTFDYGAGGKLSRITYPDGRTTQWDYNAAGDLVRYQDVNGDVTTHNYDDAGRITAITDARGLITEHSYGPYGRYTGATLADGTEIKLDIAKTLGLPDLGGETGVFVPADQRGTTLTDGRGNVTITEVNALGSPIKVTDALGRVTLYERDANNNVTAMIAPSSVTAAGTLRSEFDYDAQGNVIAKREAVGTSLERQMLYAYEPVFSKVISMIDYDGFETLYSYDEFGNILTETDPLGGVQSFSYDAAGLPLTSTDKNNNLTSMFYSLEGRIERMTDPSGTVTTFVYDGAGNLLRMTEDALGSLTRETVSTYDEKNRMLTETAADGGVTTYVYDGNDNVVSVTDPTGIVETRSYDERDRLETINDPATGATIMAYDADSNITRMTDALSETTEFAYDEVDRLLSSVDAKGQLRAFAYDLRDNITAITDARANISLITYDELDRPRSRSNPNSETWLFAYDLRDNRVSAVKPDGTLITSVYDELSRLTSLSGGDVARDYSYDAQSNLLAANDNLNGVSGAQLGFTYDGENRVETASVTNLFGAAVANNTFTYSYDAHDRRASLADSLGGTTSYGYDAFDRLTRVTTPQGDNFDTNYDLAGRTLGRVAPNATEMIRQYEAATGRLSSQRQEASGASFNGFDYAYTERGNIAGITESGDTVRDRAYSYDELERLTEVDVPTAPSQDEAYELDPEGNRLSSHLSDMNTTDAANRLTSDDNYTYVYDLNGNLTGKLAKAGTGLSDWTYSYDTLDELIEVSQDGLVVESYRYDAFGRRSLISTAEGAGLTIDVAILNDGSDRAIDIAQGALGQAIPLRRYTHSGNVDEPIQVETFDDSGSFEARYTFHADHLGSIRYLTDSSGTIVNAYDYDSYGRPMFGVTAFDQPFAYTGREWDAATGLYHYRARAYDAETGRFLQEDPIGFISGDLNIYRYVGSNPVLSKDPSGLVAIGSARINRQGKRIVGRAGLKLTPRISCLFSLAGQALELATSQRVDGIIETASDCTLKVKARPKSKGNPNHGNSVSNPKRQYYVYVLYEGTSIIKVGKGKDNRAKSQSINGRKHIKIARHLTVAEALALECTIVWAAILAEQKLSGDFSACARKAKG